MDMYVRFGRPGRHTTCISAELIASSNLLPHHLIQNTWHGQLSKLFTSKDLQSVGSIQFEKWLGVIV